MRTFGKKSSQKRDRVLEQERIAKTMAWDIDVIIANSILTLRLKDGPGTEESVEPIEFNVRQREFLSGI